MIRWRRERKHHTPITFVTPRWWYRLIWHLDEINHSYDDHYGRPVFKRLCDINDRLITREEAPTWTPTVWIHGAAQKRKAQLLSAGRTFDRKRRRRSIWRR